MRFWTAAFFDAVQCERAARPVPARSKSLDQDKIAADDRKFQANIVFGQLGYNYSYQYCFFYCYRNKPMLLKFSLTYFLF